MEYGEEIRYRGIRVGSTIPFHPRHPCTGTETRNHSDETGAEKSYVAKEPRVKLYHLDSAVVMVGKGIRCTILFILVSGDPSVQGQRAGIGVVAGTPLSRRRNVDSCETLESVSMVTVYLSGIHVGGHDGSVGRADQIQIYGWVVCWTVHLVDLHSANDSAYSIFDP